MTPIDPGSDAHLREVFMRPIRKCAQYRPAFGQGKSGGLKVSEFRALYGGDLFYAWLGLDSDAVYAAHRAAGGLTSVYRQIGVGSERLFRAILATTLGLSSEQMDWGYTYEKGRGQKAVHTLDARVQLADLDSSARSRFLDWIGASTQVVTLDTNAASPLVGAAFEVRQGYKSADSKRQNADLRFGINAYRAGLLPVFAIFSAQVSEPVLRRYRADGMLVLTGTANGDATVSTFAFARDIVGYDLRGFFERNTQAIRSEVEAIVETLLSP